MEGGWRGHGPRGQYVRTFGGAQAAALLDTPGGAPYLAPIPPRSRAPVPQPPTSSMQRILLFLALLAAFALPGRAAAQAAAADSAYLRPGDLIRLAVFRQPDFSGEFPVSPEGTIQHPLLAEVNVVGVPRSVIRERLRVALSRYERDPSFVFSFLYRVAVGGEVRLPNLYTVIPETTVGQAVATAGGLTEYGRLDRVVVARGGQEMMLDLRDPVQAETRIRSGDQVRVTRRGNLMRDVIGPFASVIGAIAAVVAIFGTN